MGDMGDYYRDWREHRKVTKEKRWHQNLTRIEKLGKQFKFNYTHNPANGQIVISYEGETVDFYASTGTWLHRGTKMRGSGIGGFIRWLKMIGAPCGTAT